MCIQNQNKEICKKKLKSGLANFIFLEKLKIQEDFKNDKKIIWNNG